MPTTYVPLKSVKASLREVRDAALEQGRKEGREEATRMLEWAVQLNGHGPLMLKAFRDSIVFKSTDASGHEHKDKGPGGGQFTSGGDSGDSKQNRNGTKPTTDRERKGKPPQKKMSEKALRAQASATRVDASIQRYCEEHNEPKFAKAVGGLSFKDNEPVDVVLGVGGVISHGIELKTMVTNKANKITMKRSAMERKAEWERANKATFHTVVIDDSGVYNANGEGNHDESKRRYFYRRGFGSFRVGTMMEVKSIAEIKKLINTPNDKLPPSAQRKGE